MLDRRARRTRDGSTCSASAARSTPTRPAAVLTAGIAAGLLPRIHANQLDRRAGRAAGGRAGRGQRRPLHPPVRRRRRRAGRSATVATLLPGAEFSTRSPYPDARAAARRRRDGRAGHRLQPRLVVHVVDAVLHRARRPRDADDAGRGAVGGHRRRRAGAAPRPTSATSASARGPTSSILDAPSYLHLAYRPGVPLDPHRPAQRRADMTIEPRHSDRDRHVTRRHQRRRRPRRRPRRRARVEIAPDAIAAMATSRVHRGRHRAGRPPGLRRLHRLRRAGQHLHRARSAGPSCSTR